MILSDVKIPVIYFHSVQDVPDPSWIKNYLTLETSVFKLFLDFLRKNKWQTIFLDEMHNLKSKQQRLNGKYCCLTFDDGYRDNYSTVFPLLQSYKIKCTIFISPEYIGNDKSIGAEHQSLQSADKTKIDKPKSAYLRWEEIREMQKSGLVDFQSHTMSHTKYFASDMLIGFHTPGDRCFYPIINHYPQYKTSYFWISDFETLIPYGTPLFEEKSSIMTKIHTVNRDFEVRVLDCLQASIKNGQTDFGHLFHLAKPIYDEYYARGDLVRVAETHDQCQTRLLYEIGQSKKVIEGELNKDVNFLCWPHGDNNEELHQIAMEAGYIATTVGKSKADPRQLDRFDRFGIKQYSHPTLTKLRIRNKLNSHLGKFPDAFISKFWKAMYKMG